MVHPQHQNLQCKLVNKSTFLLLNKLIKQIQMKICIVNIKLRFERYFQMHNYVLYRVLS